MALLTKLYVDGFRTIGPKPAEIALAPLTVLVGPNGGGKSSLLQAVALTAQSATEEEDRHNLVLSGSRVDFAPEALEEGGSLFFARRANTISVGLEMEGITLSIGPQDESHARKLGLPVWPPGRAEYRWSRSSGRWPAWSHEFIVDGMRIFRRWSEVLRAQPSSAALQSFASIGAGAAFQVMTIPDRVLANDVIPPSASSFVVQGQTVDEELLAIILELLRPVAERFREKLARVHTLTPVRGPELMHEDVGPEVEFVGKHGEETVRLLSRMQSSADKRLRTLQVWAEAFGMPNFAAGWTGGKTLKVTYDDPLTATRLDFREGAGGSQQALLLAAQVLLTRPSSVLLIDEPEIGLHPGYEKLLPELFAQAVSLGQQIIIATHSEVLIAALGNAVRRRVHGLTDNSVAVWHIQRTSAGVRPERIEISKRGYLEEWVSSFAQVEEELYEEWAEALPEKGPADRDRHPRTRRSSQGKSKAGRKRAK